MRSVLSRTTLSFFLFLFAAFLLPAGSYAVDSAVLSKLSGEVLVFQGGVGDGVAAKLDMPLTVGDKVVTRGRNSSADVTFPNGDVVRVMPGSKLILKESDFGKKSFSIRMKLVSGKIFNVVNKVGKGSKYEVETRAAVAGVRGTVWSAETSEEEGGEDVIMVKEGKVATTNPNAAPGKEVLVSRLKKTRIAEGKEPTEPEAMTAAEIAMFDVLNDLIEDIKEEIKDEIKEGIAEDLLEGNIN